MNKAGRRDRGKTVEKQRKSSGETAKKEEK